MVVREKARGASRERESAVDGRGGLGCKEAARDPSYTWSRRGSWK